MDSQVAKYKLRKAKARLAYYSTFISLLLLLSTFNNGVTMSDLLTSLLILPLPLYFALQSYKLHHKIKRSPDYPITRLPDYSFSPWAFLSQSNFAFRLSLVLFIIIGFTTLARLHY